MQLPFALPACCSCVLTALGAVLALRLAYEAASYAWLHFLRPATNPKTYGARKGGAGAAWAVVTGCTNGIGEGFAHALASKGWNVVLVARNEALLKPLAEGLTGKYGVQTKYVVVDCAAASAAAWVSLNETLSTLPGPGLALVVNNVGVNTTETPSELALLTDRDVQAMVDVNVAFHTRFTKLCIPLLQKRDTAVARRAAILHLSSFSGVFPVGLMAVYSATKAYADAFGRALHSELSGSRAGAIDSVSVVPHYVVSNMSGFDRPSLTVPRPAAFAHATLAKLGTGAQIVPHWAHDAMARVIGVLPQSYVAAKGTAMMAKVRKAHTDPAKAAKRAARKQDAEAKKADERAKFAAAATAAAAGKKDA